MSGLRVASGLVLSDRLLRPDLHVTPERAYDESATLIERYHKRGRLLYAVTPRFAYSTTESMLEVCQQLMSEHPDVLLQTHINESTAEIGELERLFPWAADYLAIYERYALSGARSVMAHNVHATPSELDRLADAGTAVAHCPGSNAALGSGCFPLRRHVDAGVTCALGTDVGGGLGFGMLKEGLHAYLMQRLAPDPKVLDAARLLYLATRAGAEALGLENDIGDFQPGKAADFVYLRPPPESVLDAAVRHAARSRAGARGAVHAGRLGERSRSPCRRRYRISVRRERARAPIDMTLAELNATDRSGFVAALGWIFEDSPWVAERAWETRPFATLDALHDAMTSVVAAASAEEQLALLRAHPDLGAARDADVGRVAARTGRCRARCADPRRARAASAS